MLILPIVFIHLSYIIIISVIKIKHLIYLWKNGYLEVRNSPLDKISTFAFKLAACVKGACVYGAGAGTAIGSGLGVDEILTQSGRLASFKPIAGDVVDNVLTKLGIDNPNSSNFMDDSSSNLFRDLLSPVDHSLPLETLINIHTLFNLILFLMTIALIILFFNFIINLFIIFNKEYLLIKVNNKYLLMYIKYVIFKYKIDIFIIGLIILVTLFFFCFALHYLVVHPIDINKF
jgi:hypothetical protein